MRALAFVGGAERGASSCPLVACLNDAEEILELDDELPIRLLHRVTELGLEDVDRAARNVRVPG